MTLLVVLLGVLVVAMSIAGTAVALPRIGVELRTSGAALQWVVAGYYLTFAAFTLVCGSLADLFGRRRMFITAAVLFVVGSLLSAVVNDIWLLNGARVLTGIGAAGVLASGGAILATTFCGATRTRAFAALGTIVGVGIALGPTVSGWLIGELGWRATFFSYGVALLLSLPGTALVAESRAAELPGWIEAV